MVVRTYCILLQSRLDPAKSDFVCETSESSFDPSGSGLNQIQLYCGWDQSRLDPYQRASANMPLHPLHKKIIKHNNKGKQIKMSKRNELCCCRHSHMVSCSPGLCNPLQCCAVTHPTVLMCSQSFLGVNM